MSRARANPTINLKLLAELAQRFPIRAASFGLKASGLLSLLVWNDSVRPNRALRALERQRQLSRVSLGCSLRAPYRAIATRRAREQDLSLNAYLEALIAAHLAQRGPLMVLNSPK